MLKNQIKLILYVVVVVGTVSMGIILFLAKDYLILSTAMIGGAMLPLAFGTGVEHESNAAMALAIIGGLISSMVLTLLVVPAIIDLCTQWMYSLENGYEKGQV